MSPNRRSVLAAAPVFASAAGFVCPASSASPRAVSSFEGDVKELVARASRGHETLMRGDLRGYRTAIAITDDFTLMAPFGGKPSRGADFTDERWEAVARFFRDGRDSTFELVSAYPSTDQVVLVAIERTHVAVGTVPAQDWALRVTLVFRKDNGQWRLAHRHADPLVAGIAVRQAAALARNAAAA